MVLTPTSFKILVGPKPVQGLLAEAAVLHPHQHVLQLRLCSGSPAVRLALSRLRRQSHSPLQQPPFLPLPKWPSHSPSTSVDRLTPAQSTGVPSLVNQRCHPGQKHRFRPSARPDRRSLWILFAKRSLTSSLGARNWVLIIFLTRLNMRNRAGRFCLCMVCAMGSAPADVAIARAIAQVYRT